MNTNIPTANCFEDEITKKASISMNENFQFHSSITGSLTHEKATQEIDFAVRADRDDDLKIKDPNKVY